MCSDVQTKPKPSNTLLSNESAQGATIPPIGNANKRANNRRGILKKTPRSCLTCGHPTCSAHTSPNFSKDHTPVCQPCAYLFELDFLVDIISSTAADGARC